MTGRVAIIDDDPDYRSSLAFLLEDYGFEVEQFATSTSFLRALETASFGAAITDLMLPGVDGFELCSRLAQSGDPPIIAVASGAIDPLSDHVLKTLGATETFAKPFDPADLAIWLIAQFEQTSGDADEASAG
ncbi:MAG: response regulator [Geminicoccaceae bacterium]